MLQISLQDVASRLGQDNPWWEAGSSHRTDYFTSVRRDYFAAFYDIATAIDVRRAAVLLGPRRVGKTVMLLQMIDELLVSGNDPTKILYASIDAPVYAGIPLENYLNHLLDLNNNSPNGTYFVIFDEIQYLKNWEVHLKDLVDRFPNVKFVASGSAAAALRLKSRESGAGRFSDFMLPPLSFLEFVKFVHADNLLTYVDETYFCNEIEKLNDVFIDYLNFGGFPELAINKKIRTQMDQFIKNDIVDKVLLKDLPNLYGIQNIQELNKLFSFLAYNTGQEASLEAISQNSGLSKPAINNYIEYLKSAFLICTLLKLPSTSKGILRQRNFKPYLTNPSMRSALFGKVKREETAVVGHLAEAAILSQWNHIVRENFNYYYRDKYGNEIDLISVKYGGFDPRHALEIKWSDNINQDDVKPDLFFAKKYGLDRVTFTSKTRNSRTVHDGITIYQMPTSWYCLNLGAQTSRAAIDLSLIDISPVAGRSARN
jgi:uncharacterized protein